MDPDHVDVLVVGGAGRKHRRVVLARAGASVAIVDKARFPRDKACGDLVGPRGLQVLDDLGLDEPAGIDLGDMVVVGPSGRRVLLPSVDGRPTPGGPGRSPGRCSTVPCGARPWRPGHVRSRGGPPVRSASVLTSGDSRWIDPVGANAG